MQLKEFQPQKSPWGFKVTFDCDYGEGQSKLLELLGPRKDPQSADPEAFKWYMLQDVPWRMSNRKTEDMNKRGQYLKGEWRKARIYVFDEDLAILLKLMLT